MDICVAFSPLPRAFAPVPLKGDIEANCALAASIGYTAVELNMGRPSEVPTDHLEEHLSRNGLKAVSIATGAAYGEEGLCLASPDAGIVDKTLERVREHCAFGARLGADVMIGMLRGRISTVAEEARQHRARFAEALAKCEKIAAEEGARLTIEPMNRYDCNFLSTVDDTMDFLKEAGCDKVLLCLDTFHMNIEEAGMGEAFDRARGRIGFVQLIDNNRLAPGLGHIDFAPIMTSLRDGGYSGYLSAEVLAIPDGEASARASFKALNSIISTGHA